MAHQYVRKLSLIICFLIGLGAALVIDRAIVEAHAAYDHSEPTADAVIPVAPTEVRVWFTQELFRREGANALEVYRVGGSRADRQDAHIDDDDRSLLIVSLAADLPPDTYTVKWRTLSADDGHEGEGEFRFTVAAAGAAEAESAEGIPSPTAGPAANKIEPANNPDAAPTNAGSNGLPCLNALVFGMVGLALVWVGSGRTHDWYGG